MKLKGITLLLAVLALPAKAAAADLPLRICTAEDPRGDCRYRSVAKALSEAQDGARFILSPGLYGEAAVLRANGVTLSAEPGAHMQGVAAEGKAALVIKGRDTLIEGLECSKIWVPDGNGACVRMEGRNLTLRRVHFHDGQQGILGQGGTILIEDSRFENLGGDLEIDVGKAHGIYIGPTDAFILRRSQILSSKEEGHEVKSRARRTLIEDNVIASLGGLDSRLIDIPMGGEIIIRNNVLQEGWHSSNPDLIGIGLERGARPQSDHTVNSILIEGNTIIIDNQRPVTLLHLKRMPEPRVLNNAIVGGRPHPAGQNRWFPNRAAAGLPAAPALRPWRDPAAARARDRAATLEPLILNREERSATWKGQQLELAREDFVFLALLTDRPGQLFTYDALHGALVEAGALPPSSQSDARGLVQDIGIGLRREFRRLDADFHTLIYHPGRGFSWEG